ncbi:MAG: tetratricopeptide repeat protein [Candidatus Eisenbacteria bacterium]
MASEKPRGRILRMAEWAEGLPISLGRWLLILAAIIVLRHFLEQTSTQSKTLYFLSYFIHYPLAYVAPLLALSVLLAALARERIERVTRLMLFAWLLTLLPPLIDIVAHRGSETPQLIGYLIPRGYTLGQAFLNLLNPAFQSFQGTTTGIRVEAGIGCIAGAVYVWLKTRSAGRAVVSFFAVYVAMFFFFALPPITLAVARFFGAQADNVYVFYFARASVHRAFVNATPFAVSDLSNSLVDMFVLVPVLAVWYRLYDAERFRALVRGIDPFRSGAHVAATLGGAALAARLLLGSEGLLSITHAFDTLSVAGILAASFFTSLTAGAMRAIHADADADPRVLVERRTLASFYVAFACLFAVSVSYVALTYVLATLACWYLYYARPFRLARFPLLSGFVAGGALLFSFTLGYAAYAGASASLWLPGSVAALCLFVPTLAMLARDVWSPDGERFGLSSLLKGERDRAAAGAGVFLACLLPAALLAMPKLLIPGAVVGAAGFALVARGRRERIPGGLAALAAVLALVACLLGACVAPVLRAQLESQGFSRVVRKEGNFSLAPPGVPHPEGGPMHQGLELFRKGDFESAAAAFRLALEEDPEDLAAYLSIGSAYLRLERLSEAARAFRKAIDLDAANPSAHLGLGQTYQLYEDYDAAFEELTRALELDPLSAEVVYSFSAFYQAIGDVEQEMQSLVRTTELAPARGAAWSRLADLYLAREMYEQAADALTRGLAEGAAIDHVRTRLAQAHYMAGNLGQAERELRTAIEESPRLASPRAVLSRVLAEQGRTDEARGQLREAIALTSDPELRSRFEAELSSLSE